MVCKGRCAHYMAKVKRFLNTNSRTGLQVDNRVLYPGLCRCTTCDLYLIWEGRFCPCCGIRVCRCVRKKTQPPSLERYKEESRRQSALLRVRREIRLNGMSAEKRGAKRKPLAERHG